MLRVPMPFAMTVRDGKRTAGHWVVIALIALVAIAYLEGFRSHGPGVAPALLMAWAILATPVLMAAYGRSGSKALGRGGLLAVFWSFAVMIGYDILPSYSAPSLVYCGAMLALPLYVSYRAIRRVYAARPPEPATAESRTRTTVEYCGLAIVFALLSLPTWRLSIATSGSETREEFTANHAGCYRLQFGRSSPIPWPGDGQPMRIRLDTVRVRPWGGETRFLIRPGRTGVGLFWRPVSAEEVALLQSNRYVGWTARLLREGDGYVGATQTFSDFQAGPPARQRAWAERIDCALVPVDSVRGDEVRR